FRLEQGEVSLQVKGRRIGGKTLEIKNLRKAYEDNLLIDNFSYTFARRDRIGIVGPNGAGKTTFLRMIMGEEPTDSGKLRTGETIVYGYYRQSGFQFKDNQRVIEAVTEAAEEVELSKSQTVSAAQLLEHFLFPRSMHYNLVETLSGGEKRRLHLLRVLMTNPNFLILDEPTNDLDLVTLRRLEEFLYSFEGCLLVVTHDRFFMDRIIDHLFVFEGKGYIRDYPGSYSQYREWAETQEAPESKPEKVEGISPKNTPAPEPKKPRKGKLSYNEKREFEKLEPEIERLEAQQARLQELMAGAGADFEALGKYAAELEEVKADLEAKSDRWLELMAVLEGEE
ncbi:MAG: ATP-binding cassette domain-containing protein, partial [Bacteroidota bacterium]